MKCKKVVSRGWCKESSNLINFEQHAPDNCLFSLFQVWLQTLISQSTLSPSISHHNNSSSLPLPANPHAAPLPLPANLGPVHSVAKVFPTVRRYGDTQKLIVEKNLTSVLSAREDSYVKIISSLIWLRTSICSNKKSMVGF